MRCSGWAISKGRFKVKLSVAADPEYAWGYFDLARFLCAASPPRLAEANQATAAGARDPFAWGSALALGAAFDPALPDTSAQAVKNNLSRQQFGATFSGVPKKNRARPSPRISTSRV